MLLRPPSGLWCGDTPQKTYLAYRSQALNPTWWGAWRRYYYDMRSTSVSITHLSYSQIIENETTSDFVDLNCGCPIDLVCNRLCGAALMTRPKKLLDVVSSLSKHLTRSITVKLRVGWDVKSPNAHKILPDLQKASNGRIAAVMVSPCIDVSTSFGWFVTHLFNWWFTDPW
jgi:hypothetical protein